MAKPAKKNKQSAKATTDYYQYAYWILILLVLICYLPVLDLGLTELDDTVFINDKHGFISHLGNIIKAFAQGCFNEQDIYYRPVLLVYFILLNPFTSHTSIAVYHFGSVAFHVLNVLLLFKLLTKFTGKRDHSFWLTAFFCVHPALTMAVAWIPGINDLLLTTFAFGYFLSLLKIVEDGMWKDILLNMLFLLLALFTKESGAFVPVGGFLLLWYKGYLKDFGEKFSLVIPLTVVAWGIWFFARKNVLPENTPALINTDMISLVLHRATGLIQYFGKCILPFNLNVFPTIEGTSLLWGLAAVAVIALLIVLNKDRNIKNVLIAVGWFVLFLLPIFFVPKNINNQLYEHRLYLPMLGILLLLRETILFSSTLKISVRQIIVFALVVTCIVDIHLYTPAFKDTFSFWSSAVAASPESAYANKLLGIKLTENHKEAEAISYIKKAYRLDSNEIYTRFFLARLIYIPEQNWDSARHLLDREVEIHPKFPDTYAELAHVCIEQKDFSGAEKSILKFLEFKPNDPLFNSNLLLLYKDKGDFTQALKQAENMKTRGLIVNDGLYKAIVDSAKTNPSRVNK